MCGCKVRMPGLCKVEMPCFIGVGRCDATGANRIERTAVGLVECVPGYVFHRPVDFEAINLFTGT